MSEKKTYIGDSVYADMDQWGDVVLTTENGLGPSNTIYLDRDVLENFFKFVTLNRPLDVELCIGCGKNPADLPGKLCQGCAAYKEHQQ